MGWKISWWWHMIKQMDNANTRFDETWWTKGHGMFDAHEKGGLLKA
jgi:hypothetical protein